MDEVPFPSPARPRILVQVSVPPGIVLSDSCQSSCMTKWSLCAALLVTAVKSIDQSVGLDCASCMLVRSSCVTRPGSCDV